MTAWSREAAWQVAVALEGEPSIGCLCLSAVALLIAVSLPLTIWRGL